MTEIAANSDMVAFCGLYCGACRAHLKGRCPGCHENAKASWCKIRTCCSDHSYASCADCREHDDPNDCRKFNNVFAKAIGLVLNSDRRACVLKIRQLGVNDYAVWMAQRGKQTLPRRGRG